MTQTLPELLKDAPLVVCLGPGGVGKTTVSAVIALHQAAAGERSLVLTIDPARRLADALNLTSLTNDPAKISSFLKMHPSGTLSALMLDPTATFDHMISMLVSDPERRKVLLENKFYQHMSRSLAGTLEYMAVERLHDLACSEDFDSIVLDTPPTTNALDFLDAPDRIASFFSEKVTRWFLPDQESQSWTKRIFKRAGSSALSLLSRVAGDSFVEDTVAFFTLFGDLLGHFQSRGVDVGQLLRNPNAVFLVVCGPDLNRIAEAKAIDKNLKKGGCKARAFIVNRVDQGCLPKAQELDDALAKATALLGGSEERERVASFINNLEALRKNHESTTTAHQQAIEAMQQYAGSRPVYTSPAVPMGQSPRASLLAIYIGLFAEKEGLAVAELAAVTPADKWPSALERRRLIRD